MTDGGWLGTLPYRMRLPRPGRVVKVMRSHLHAPPIDHASIREVLDRYGLVATDEGANLPLGWRTDNVVVGTSTGSVVVRRFPERLDADTILHEHSIIQRLTETGFPVAPLLVNRMGETLTSACGRHFAVSEFVPGVSLTACYLPSRVVRRLFREAGTLLSGFHTELQAFSPRGRHRLGLRSSDRTPVRGPEWHLEALERLRHEASRDATERWLVEQSGAIGETIVRLHDELAEGHLSVGVIHGDYGLHNLTFAGDATPTVHDLELARLDWLLIDVVIVLSRSKVASGRAFLEGYRSVRDFDPCELALLPEVWQHYRLCGAVQSWHNYREFGGAGRLVTARSRVEEADRVARLGSDWGGWGVWEG